PRPGPGCARVRPRRQIIDRFPSPSPYRLHLRVLQSSACPRFLSPALLPPRRSLPDIPSPPRQVLAHRLCSSRGSFLRNSTSSLPSADQARERSHPSNRSPPSPP